MPSNYPDSKRRPDQDDVPGWRPASVARLLRGRASTPAEALDEMDRQELRAAVERLARAKKLPWTASRIVTALLQRANRSTGLCNPAAATIAADAACGVRTVERNVPLLRAAGIIDTDCERREGQGRGKPPRKTSNRFTFAKIGLGRAAEFAASAMIAPALENYARARKAATERLAAIRALTGSRPTATTPQRQEMTDLLTALTDMREAKPPEYVPTIGTGARLLAALDRRQTA